MNSRRARGFTLIELMVVVMVVAILAAIAIPSYLEQAAKGRRADAMRGVGSMQLALERWRAECFTYADNAGCRDPDGNGTDDIPYPSQSGDYYTFAISGANATAYTITATRTAGGKQANDRCGNLTATRANTKPTWSGDADCNN